MKLKIVAVLLSTVLMLGVTTPVFAYDQAAAQRYADKYVFNYNDSYRDFTKHDCTNFVSQCLRAGGLKQDYTWQYAYYGCPKAWCDANALKEYMKNNLGATKLSNWAYNAGYRGSTYYYSYRIDNSSNIQGLGSEVVFYDWEGDGIMDHASIVVGTSHPYKDDYGRIAEYNKSQWGDLIDQHDSDRRHQLWHLNGVNRRRETTLIYVFRLK